jgi:hypothetical protein
MHEKDPHARVAQRRFEIVSSAVAKIISLWTTCACGV